MKKNIAIIVVVGIMCLVSAMAFVGMCQAAGAETKSAASANAPVKVNNTVCPVTGEKVDMKNPVTVEYKGNIYNLCCPMCTATFNSNPEKYSKIAGDQAKGK